MYPPPKGRYTVGVDSVVELVWRFQFAHADIGFRAQSVGDGNACGAFEAASRVHDVRIRSLGASARASSVDATLSRMAPEDARFLRDTFSPFAGALADYTARKACEWRGVSLVGAVVRRGSASSKQTPQAFTSWLEREAKKPGCGAAAPHIEAVKREVEPVVERFSKLHAETIQASKLERRAQAERRFTVRFCA